MFAAVFRVDTGSWLTAETRQLVLETADVQIVRNIPTVNTAQNTSSISNFALETGALIRFFCS